MDVPMITMDPTEAGTKLEHYRTMRPERLTEDDLATMAGYRALAEGNPIIDVAVAMRDAGLDGKEMPRLAVGRADWRAVTFSQGSRGAGAFLKGRNSTASVALPEGTWSPAGYPETWKWRAYLPTIPPEHRPAPSQLRRYHVLWEAVWEPAPPVDPFLLKHLAGTLYVVLAQWDLTELEQAVLRGRIAADAR